MPSSPGRSSTTRRQPTTRGSGPSRRRTSSTGTPSGRRSSTGSCPTPSGSSAASSTSAANCLDRHVAAGNGDRVAIHWEGEPGDTRTITYADLHAEVQRFANALKGLGVVKGDRVNIYLPMIPEAAVAMLACAAHRCAAQRGVRWLLGAGPCRPDQRRRGQAADHGGRRIPARRGVPVEAGCRRSRGGDVDDRTRRGRTPRRQRRGDGRRPRPLVPRPRGGRRSGVSSRADGRRGPPLPAVHVGHDRQAQGHHAHHRRLPHPGRLHAQVRVRHPSGDRRVLVHRRRRLGHRAQLHRVRAARQRHDDRDVRGRSQLSGQRPFLGRSSRSTRSPSCTRRRRRSARS